MAYPSSQVPEKVRREPFQVPTDPVHQTRYRLCAGICYFVNYTDNALSK